MANCKMQLGSFQRDIGIDNTAAIIGFMQEAFTKLEQNTQLLVDTAKEDLSKIDAGILSQQQTNLANIAANQSWLERLQAEVDALELGGDGVTVEVINQLIEERVSQIPVPEVDWGVLGCEGLYDTRDIVGNLLHLPVVVDRVKSYHRDTRGVPVSYTFVSVNGTEVTARLREEPAENPNVPNTYVYNYDVDWFGTGTLTITDVIQQTSNTHTITIGTHPLQKTIPNQPVLVEQGLLSMNLLTGLTPDLPSSNVTNGDAGGGSSGTSSGSETQDGTITDEPTGGETASSG